MRTLDPDRALLEAAGGDALEALYILAITTGMRQGELLGLKWEDVDLEARTILVQRTLSTAMGGGVHFTLRRRRRADAASGLRS